MQLSKGSLVGPPLATQIGLLLAAWMGLPMAMGLQQASGMVVHPPLAIMVRLLLEPPVWRALRAAGPRQVLLQEVTKPVAMTLDLTVVTGATDCACHRGAH